MPTKKPTTAPKAAAAGRSRRQVDGSDCLPPKSEHGSCTMREAQPNKKRQHPLLNNGKPMASRFCGRSTMLHHLSIFKWSNRKMLPLKGDHEIAKGAKPLVQDMEQLNQQILRAASTGNFNDDCGNKEWSTSTEQAVRITFEKRPFRRTSLDNLRPPSTKTIHSSNNASRLQAIKQQ